MFEPDFTLRHCVDPQNIHTSPTEGVSEKNPHPFANSNKLHPCLYILWSFRAPLPHPQEFPIPSVGGGGGGIIDIFYTFLWVFCDLQLCLLDVR